jgi:hypothetical protein
MLFLFRFLEVNVVVICPELYCVAFFRSRWAATSFGIVIILRVSHLHDAYF